MMAGYPVSSTRAHASSMLLANPPGGTWRPMRCIASVKSSRSSAMAMERALAPMSSTPYFSRIPCSWSCIARLSAVCPPMVGRMASGRSFSMTRSTHSGVRGSM
jgi:hypothetical protein